MSVNLPLDQMTTEETIVEPSTRYRVSFAAKTKEIVTGGLPMVIVTAATGEGKRLGHATPVQQNVNDWQVFSCDFSTGPSTHAVTFSLQRESCTTSPCPNLWLSGA
jgi:hypothetical protein